MYGIFGPRWLIFMLACLSLFGCGQQGNTLVADILIKERGYMVCAPLSPEAHFVEPVEGVVRLLKGWHVHQVCLTFEKGYQWSPKSEEELKSLLAGLRHAGVSIVALEQARGSLGVKYEVGDISAPEKPAP